MTLFNRSRFVSAGLVATAVALHSESVPACVKDAGNLAVCAIGDDFVGLADDRVSDIGSPKLPADSGTQNSSYQSFVVSEVVRFPELLDKVEWFPGTKVLVELHYQKLNRVA